MNSTWTENAKLFQARFPELFALHRDALTEEPAEGPAEVSVFFAKSGDPTAREKGALLHSAYDPKKEAARLITGNRETLFPEKSVFIFLGFGLGYGPLSVPDAEKVIVVEPDPARLALAFRFQDWRPLLKKPGFHPLIGATVQTVIGALTQLVPNLSDARIFAIEAQSAHAAAYFQELRELIERNVEKQGINGRTLQKYGALWRRNTARNLYVLAETKGVETLIRENSLVTEAVVVGAGPSLEETLPLLKKLRPLICVDTALRTLLNAGIEPEYIVVSDAQYWNARHLMDLAAPHASLVTEIAVHPSVFRFSCRRILLYASANPVTQEILAGKNVPDVAPLAAGGSVASVAWDLARHLGCKTVYLAGVDLGFPDKRTHARGSLFEIQSHQKSQRTAPAETAAVAALFSAPSFAAADYTGSPLLTDQRMRLYAWWFESTLAKHPEVQTFTLSEKSLAIPGIRVAPERA